jgi:hypothetical protein
MGRTSSSGIGWQCGLRRGLPAFRFRAALTPSIGRMNRVLRGPGSMPERRQRRPAVIMAIWAVVAAFGVLWLGHTAWAAFKNRSTPSCSWPLRIRGKPTAAQAGLVRCYLRALAGHDTAGLAAVADNMPPVRITRADFKHSADARSGLATAAFLPATTDVAYVPLIIRYADGASDRLGIQNLIAMGGPSSWRMAIGTDINQGSGPAPATAAPPPTRTPRASPAPRGMSRPGN